MSAYLAEIETRVAGIPCLIAVSFYFVQRPRMNADNTDDYNGYTECDYDILDRKGRLAPWLSAKLTAADDARIVAEVDAYFENSYEY